MKRYTLCAAATTALCLLLPKAAAAQAILTPTEVTTGSFLPAGATSYRYIATITSVSPADETLAFSVDEQYLPAGASSTVGILNVWTVPRFGASGTRVTTFGPGDNEFAFVPQWNPAQLLAYIQRKFTVPAPSQTMGPFRLAVMGTGPITPENISLDNSFTWGPDGATLVFVAEDESQLEANGDVLKGPNAIYTVAYNGSGLKNIHDCTPQPCTDAEWSQDNLIAFSQNRSIGLMGPSGTNPHVIVANGDSPAWSPTTGGQFAYSCGDDICVAPEDGAGPVVNLTNGFSGLTFSQPSWSSDESLIAVVGTTPATSGIAGDIFVVSVGGHTLVQLTTGGASAEPQFSPILAATNNPNPPNFVSPSPFELFYRCIQPGSLNADICVLQGFGHPTSGCDPTNCAGCCLQGLCFPGGGGTACGAGGQACAVCTGGQLCNGQGACADPTFCGIGTCPGCCDSHNLCHEPPGGQWCGRNGEPCQTCSNGQFCDPFGQCPPETCGAANCAGCCTADNRCMLPGTSNSACGLAGQRCDVCTGGRTCSDSGTCDNPGCTITGCTTGCCDPATDTCMPGDQDNACGLGRDCLDCTASGYQCDKNARDCAPPTVGCQCSSGCCDGSRCVGGNSNQACGILGERCQVCGVNANCVFGAGFCN